MSNDRLPLHRVSTSRELDQHAQRRREIEDAAKRQVNTDNYRRLVNRVNNASDREMERALSPH